jgi:hypothetical protein
MCKTTNIKTNDAEMRIVSDAELDAIVGGMMSINIPGDKTKPTAPGASGQVTGSADPVGWAVDGWLLGAVAGACVIAAIA